MKLAGKADFDALHRWSIEQPGEFWELLWRFCQVRGEAGLRRLINPERMPGAKWFPEAKLNFAENCTRVSSLLSPFLFSRSPHRNSPPTITFSTG